MVCSEEDRGLSLCSLTTISYCLALGISWPSLCQSGTSFWRDLNLPNYSQGSWRLTCGLRTLSIAAAIANLYTSRTYTCLVPRTGSGGLGPILNTPPTTLVI